MGKANPSRVDDYRQGASVEYKSPEGAAWLPEKRGSKGSFDTSDEDAAELETQARAAGLVVVVLRRE